jgi:phage/plasmid-associated DNA primase
MRRKLAIDKSKCKSENVLKEKEVIKESNDQIYGFVDEFLELVMKSLHI